MTRYIKSTRAAPPPKATQYSHAVEAGGCLYISGQLPIDPSAPTQPPPAGIEAQSELVLENLRLIAEDAGYTLADTVFARVFLADFDRDFAGFMAVYHRHFIDEAKMPARTTVGVSKLGRGSLVEVDCVLSRV